MNEPEWLDLEIIVAIHDEQIEIHGGAAGLRDQGLLESALDRPRNKWAYGEEDLAVLAAAYGYAFARNHPFIDGNKRTALLSIVTFLGLNDIDFLVDEPSATAMILELAAGNIPEEGLARWIRDNWPVSG